MKQSAILTIMAFCAIGIPINLQAQYTVTKKVDQLRAVQQMQDFEDPYSFNLTYEEAPYPDGEDEGRAFLRQQKLKAQKLTPVVEGPALQYRGTIPAPDLLASFSGNNIISSTPLDNHLAIGPLEEVVSTINVHMLVTRNTGFWLGSYKLDNFFASLGTTNRLFDPRVIYDPEMDRFILVAMNDSECNESQICFAFSQTNNPRGAWNLYAIDGCLDDDGTFADYPMISITDKELFLTYNEVNGDSSWQTGFMGTQIHQINKMNGYNGEALNRKVWRDISYNGKLIRNICPVRNADETLPQDMYFVSTRNFAISNDTVFIVHLTGHEDDPNASLDIAYRLMDNPYGAPPYAAQPKDSMDTNDARVLDAFRLDDEIQFVGNTMDFSTGRSGVYHGFINTDNAIVNGIGNTIGHPTDYLGYPGIAWTGADPSQHDAIIVVSHVSHTRFPGGSAVYSDGHGQYSDFTTIIEGTKPVDMLTGPIERWGDYAGMQRFYSQPGSVWISCSYGRQGNVNEAWIGKLARHEEMVAVSEPAQKTAIKTYPNPANDYINIEIDNPTGQKINATLFDAAGHPVHVLYDALPAQPGKTGLHFSTHVLPPGQYFVRVRLGDHEAASRSFVKS